MAELLFGAETEYAVVKACRRQLNSELNSFEAQIPSKLNFSIFNNPFAVCFVKFTALASLVLINK